jgi:MFS family permease
MPSPGIASAPVRAQGTLRSTAAGFCATLVGVGLARFAYTPLLPAIIGAGWFEASSAAYLGAANLAGYLAGALLGRPMAARFGTVATLRAMMLLAALAFFACAYPLSLPWFFSWRLLSGIAGGVLTVVAAPAVLAQVDPARRGVAGGILFMGVGMGVAASGTLVPQLLKIGLRETWLGLGSIAVLLTVLAWRGWPQGPAAAAKETRAGSAADRALAMPTAESFPATGTSPRRANILLLALWTLYALHAVAWMPHMIFLVDYVARGLGQGLQIGAQYWVWFGIGATVGPLAAGAIADRIGFGLALRLAFVIELVGVALPALHHEPVWLIVSSLSVGAFVTGVVPLVLGRLHELLGRDPARRDAAWRTATVCFAVVQALAAYGMSFLFSHTQGNYTLLFLIGAAAMIAVIGIDLATLVCKRRNP